MSAYCGSADRARVDHLLHARPKARTGGIRARWRAGACVARQVGSSSSQCVRLTAPSASPAKDVCPRATPPRRLHDADRSAGRYRPRRCPGVRKHLAVIARRVSVGGMVRARFRLRSRRARAAMTANGLRVGAFRQSRAARGACPPRAVSNQTKTNFFLMSRYFTKGGFLSECPGRAIGPRQQLAPRSSSSRIFSDCDVPLNFAADQHRDEAEMPGDSRMMRGLDGRDGWFARLHAIQIKFPPVIAGFVEFPSLRKFSGNCFMSSHSSREDSKRPRSTCTQPSVPIHFVPVWMSS